MRAIRVGEVSKRRDGLLFPRVLEAGRNVKLTGSCCVDGSTLFTYAKTVVEVERKDGNQGRKEGRAWFLWRRR